VSFTILDVACVVTAVCAVILTIHFV